MNVTQKLVEKLMNKTGETGEEVMRRLQAAFAAKNGEGEMNATLLSAHIAAMLGVLRCSDHEIRRVLLSRADMGLIEEMMEEEGKVPEPGPNQEVAFRFDGVPVYAVPGMNRGEMAVVTGEHVDTTYHPYEIYDAEKTEPDERDVLAARWLLRRVDSLGLEGIREITLSPEDMFAVKAAVGDPSIPELTTRKCALFFKGIELSENQDYDPKVGTPVPLGGALLAKEDGDTDKCLLHVGLIPDEEMRAELTGGNEAETEAETKAEGKRDPLECAPDCCRTAFEDPDLVEAARVAVKATRAVGKGTNGGQMLPRWKDHTKLGKAALTCSANRVRQHGSGKAAYEALRAEQPMADRGPWETLPWGARFQLEVFAGTVIAYLGTI